MTLLLIYGWLALATAIAGLVDLIYPVLQAQSARTGKPVPYKLALYTGFLACFILGAPVVLACYFSPHLGWTFRNSLQESLFPDPKP
jgi:hypothetical protein